MPYKDPEKNRQYQQEWWRKKAAEEGERERRRVARREWVQARVAEVARFKEGKPCADCGGIFPPVAMDFDHLDGSDKSNGISQMARGGWSMARILEEIEKCELVCANCHRVRTHDRGY